MNNSSVDVHVKICCISSIGEAELAISHGANIIGLVSDMPSGPGIIAESEIKQIIEHVAGRVDCCLLTSKQDVEEIIRQCQYMRPSMLQIVDALPLNAIKELRQRLADIQIIQVLHVLDEEIVREAIRFSSYVDGILLDSGNPNKSVKELGGTGRTHDWNISKFIVEELDIPVYLAGGIKADNVEEAVKITNPFGVDLCSGVRTNGQLDPEKLEQFMKRLRNEPSSSFRP